MRAFWSTGGVLLDVVASVGEAPKAMRSIEPPAVVTSTQ